MRWLAEVHVALRPGIADPEGQTIGSALRVGDARTERHVNLGQPAHAQLQGRPVSRS